MTILADGLLISASEINRELPVLPQECTYGNVTLIFNNVDGAFSVLRAATPWQGRKIAIYHGNFYDGADELSRIFTGQISGNQAWQVQDQEAQIVVRDASYDKLNQDIRLAIDKSIFPNLPDKWEKKLVPVPYGTLDSWAESKDYKADTDAAKIEGVGAVKALLINDSGKRTATGGFTYAAAAHSLKSIIRVYHDGKAIAASTYAIGSSIEYGGQKCVTLRFNTDQRLYDESGNLISDGDEITFDCQGAASGTSIITHPALQMRHYLINQVGISASDIASAPSDCDHSPFCEDAFIHASLLNDYEAAWVADGDLCQYAAIIANLMLSSNLILHQTRGGKYTCSYATLEFDGDPNVLEKFNDEDNLVKETFSVIPVQEHASRIKANYKPAFMSGTYTETVDEADAVEDLNLTGIGGSGIETNIDLPYVRDSGTALSIALERLSLMREARSLVYFDVHNSRLKNIDLGKYILMTHYRGPNSPTVGWTNRICKVIGLRTSIMPDQERTTVMALDLGYDVDLWLHAMRWGDENQNVENWADATDWDKTFGYWGDASQADTDPCKVFL